MEVRNHPSTLSTHYEQSIRMEGKKKLINRGIPKTIKMFRKIRPKAPLMRQTTDEMRMMQCWYFEKRSSHHHRKLLFFVRLKSNNFQSSIIRNAGPPPKFTPTVDGPVTKIISIIEFLEVCHITTRKLLSCFKHKKLELYEYLAWWVNPSLEKSVSKCSFPCAMQSG